jgi:hypothetical protein
MRSTKTAKTPVSPSPKALSPAKLDPALYTRPVPFDELRVGQYYKIIMPAFKEVPFVGRLDKIQTERTRKYKNPTDLRARTHVEKLANPELYFRFHHLYGDYTGQHTGSAGSGVQYFTTAWDARRHILAARKTFRNRAMSTRETGGAGAGAAAANARRSRQTRRRR